MTAAEQLRALGESQGLEKGLEQGRVQCSEKIAINLLKDGAEAQFVVRNTGLELDMVLKLKAQLAH